MSDEPLFFGWIYLCLCNREEAGCGGISFCVPPTFNRLVLLMETFVTIIEQRPLQSRNFQDNQGQNRTFHSRGFVLSNGIDEFYAEMTGEQALQCGEFDRALLHRFQGVVRQRRFTDKNGQERFENVIYITKLV